MNVSAHPALPIQPVHIGKGFAGFKKILLHALLEEVILAVFRDEYRAHLMLRWRGGRLTELDVTLPRSATVRTDEGTLRLVRRLAVHYPDAVIAGILNRQKRTTARGLRFTANLVGNLRRHGSKSRASSQHRLTPRGQTRQHPTSR